VLQPRGLGRETWVALAADCLMTFRDQPHSWIKGPRTRKYWMVVVWGDASMSSCVFKITFSLNNPTRSLSITVPTGFRRVPRLSVRCLKGSATLRTSPRPHMHGFSTLTVRAVRALCRCWGCGQVLSATQAIAMWSSAAEKKEVCLNRTAELAGDVVVVLGVQAKTHTVVEWLDTA
jgi:hypothetical protein